MALLALRNLAQSYGRRKVLRQIDFELGEAEMVVLIGANGAGKTTLLKVMSGLLTPERGDVTADAPLSLFFPESYLYEDLTLRENLALYNALGAETDGALYREIQSLLVPETLLDQPVRHLSRGQRTRGALCRTFLMSAAAYLLDEPWSGLDYDASERLVRALECLRHAGKSVVIVTHQPEILKGIADRFIKLEGGRLLPLS